METQQKNIARIKVIITGTIVLSFIYLAYIYIARESGIMTPESTSTATIIFIVSYFCFLLLANSYKTNFLARNKKNIINISFLFAPLVIAAIAYVILKSFLIAVILFIVGQIAYTAYYKHFVPVPGYNKAYKLYAQGDNEKTRVALNHILEKYPGNYETLVLLGAVYIREKSYEQAVEVLEKARSINPELPVAYLNLMNTYIALENFEKTIEISTIAIELTPRAWNLYYFTGLSHFFLANYQQAIDNFEKTLQLNLPALQLFLVHFGLARSYEAIQAEKKAKEEYNKTVKAASEQTLDFWENELRKSDSYTNKPFLFVKEALQYAKKG
jgi:tetratricopeptide (TPR) repeat protein